MDQENKIYRIEQGFQFEGDDWWKWWIWIEAPDADLDKIDYVVYTLHSTFVNPVRTIRDRASKFILKTEGWGTFPIYAGVYLKDGTTISLEHELFLNYPSGEKNME